MGPLAVTLLLVGGGFPVEPGIHERTFDSARFGQVRFTISIPKGYVPDEPRPLVLALHFGGPVTPGVGKGFLVVLAEPGLRRLGAIIVAPDCPSRGWDNPESEGAVMELLQKISREYGVDRRRILVMGYSMGGKGAWYLASRHPDVFTAALPVSGTPGETRLEPLLEMPVCAVHSVLDPVVPIGPTRDALRTLQDRGGTTKLVMSRQENHHEVSGFVQPLTQATAWIEKQWDEP